MTDERRCDRDKGAAGSDALVSQVDLSAAPADRVARRCGAWLLTRDGRGGRVRGGEGCVSED